MNFKFKDYDSTELNITEIEYVWCGSIYDNNKEIVFVFGDGEMLRIYYNKREDRNSDYNELGLKLKEIKA